VSADPREEAEETVAKGGLGFAVAWDPELAAIDAWGVRQEGKTHSVPAVFVVGRGGVIRSATVGEGVTDRAAVPALLEALDG